MEGNYVRVTASQNRSSSVTCINHGDSQARKHNAISFAAGEFLQFYTAKHLAAVDSEFLDNGTYSDNKFYDISLHTYLIIWLESLTPSGSDYSLPHVNQ